MYNLKKSSRFWIIFFLYLITKCLLYAMPSNASEPIEFGLSWDSITDADLDGYEIYFKKGVPGSSYEIIGDIYVDELVDPENPWVIISSLYNGVTNEPENTIKVNELTDKSTYYFAASAFDTQGNVSDLSEEICVEVIGSSVNTCRPSSGDDNDEGSAIEDLIDDLGKLGCFISTINDEIRYNSHLSITSLFLWSISIFGVLVGRRAKK